MKYSDVQLSEFRPSLMEASINGKVFESDGLLQGFILRLIWYRLYIIKVKPIICSRRFLPSWICSILMIFWESLANIKMRNSLTFTMVFRVMAYDSKQMTHRVLRIIKNWLKWQHKQFFTTCKVLFVLNDEFDNGKMGISNIIKVSNY